MHLPIYPKISFELTNRIDNPLDLNKHFPFRLAVVINLLQLNKDATIRNITALEPREFRVLLNVGSYMPIKAADIAYLGRLDSYTVSRAVKTLMREELIRVEPSEINKKIKNLVLTDKGIEIYRRLCDSIEVRTDELESVLTPREKNELLRLLSVLESKSESMIANHAIEQTALGKNVSADQKEIVRWFRKSASANMAR
jgi:DNA-binding MarR family transcriptional regulator